MTELKGCLYNPDSKIAIVVAEFNHFVTNSLLTGTIAALQTAGGVKEENITTVRVPGAYEIPFIAKRLAQAGKYDAIVALGAVIRGSTPHFDYVCGPMASQIMQISLDSDIPVSFGVLTTNTIEEAIERCGTKAGNKGIDAAHVALEMLNLKKLV